VKTGAEPKKVAMLAGLLAVAAGTFYFNVIATDEQPAAKPAAAVPVAAPPAPANAAPVARPGGGGRAEAPVRRVGGKTAVNEFRPRMGPAAGEEKPDPAAVDPALHLELLAKLQTITPAAAGRNLFQYGSAPAPPKVELPKVEKIEVKPAPPPPPVQPATKPGPPPPAPVTFKYYGLKTARLSGAKVAFLLDGEDIIVVGENEVVKKRYRVVRIGPTSIVVEDLQGQGQQTVQIEGQPTA
jgi:hypothetical protein